MQVLYIMHQFNRNHAHIACYGFFSENLIKFIPNLYIASNEDCNRIVVCQRDIQHLSSKYTFKEYIPIYNLTIYISLSNMYYEFAFQ